MFDLLRIYKALADETRLRLIRLLVRGPLNVNEILSILRMGQSRISRHLKILSEARLVTSRREGTWVYYQGNIDRDEKIVADVLCLLKNHEQELPHYLSDLQGIEQVIEQRGQNMRIFFDNIADPIELQHPIDGQYLRQLALNHISSGCEVGLDLGTGAGLILPELLGLVSRVIAIDSSRTMLNMARNLVQEGSNRCDFRLGDLSHLPVADGEVDCVIACMVLHHVSNPRHCLKEAFRVLRKDGYLIIVDLYRHQDETLREKMADLWFGFLPDEIENWLKNENFFIEHSQVLGNPEEFRSLLFKARKEE
ncbi:MAG: metalloregulator ArsR/SmtB family transcription factor [Candidatus Latescibacterota bacterium]|nr:metalloregulator ArsR/SmtB family transcription factor [Candidatus Latescibacterota bacterium]